MLVALQEALEWLDRAEQAREVAGQLTDPAAKKAVLELAESFDRLAPAPHPSRGAQTGVGKGELQQEPHRDHLDDQIFWRCPAGAEGPACGWAHLRTSAAHILRALNWSTGDFRSLERSKTSIETDAARNVRCEAENGSSAIDLVATAPDQPHKQQPPPLLPVNAPPPGN
jgi:hypothetical protein